MRFSGVVMMIDDNAQTESKKEIKKEVGPGELLHVQLAVRHRLHFQLAARVRKRPECGHDDVNAAGVRRQLRACRHDTSKQHVNRKR